MAWNLYQYDGTAIPSMTSKLIEANTTEEGNIVDESTIVTSTSVAYTGPSTLYTLHITHDISFDYTAGADTVTYDNICILNRIYLRAFFFFLKIVSSLTTFILAMVLYPDVQRRGQEELDLVIGKDNLPTMKDRLNLPYIDAICREVLRYVFNQEDCVNCLDHGCYLIDGSL